jgi:hypothetical protein
MPVSNFLLSYVQKSDMDSDTTQANSTYAQVLNDPTPASGA